LSRPATPLPLKRQLRQESNFSCALCPCPLLRYHHIIPWEECHSFAESDMIALCPTHHARADAGTITRQELFAAKRGPYGRTVVRETDFIIPGTVASVRLGSNTFIDTPRLVVVDELDIIAATFEGGRPTLNAVLIDQFNNWIGIIEENEWVFDRRAIWDIEYTPKHLTVRSEPRKVSLEVIIEASTVSIRGEFYYNGVPIVITESDARFGVNRALVTTGSTFENAPIAINLSSF